MLVWNVPVKSIWTRSGGGERHMHHYPCSYHLAWQSFVWENLADKWCSKRRRRCLFSGWLLRLFCEEYLCTLCQITKVIEFLKNRITHVYLHFIMWKRYGLFWIITTNDWTFALLGPCIFGGGPLRSLSWDPGKTTAIPSETLQDKHLVGESNTSFRGQPGPDMSWQG